MEAWEMPEMEVWGTPRMEVWGTLRMEAEMSDKKKRVIDLKHIVKRFYIGQPNELEILHKIDLSVEKGEFISIVGESGSGKSTLMNIIGALDRPTEGEYYLEGTDVCLAKDKKLSELRNQKIGFIFQTYNLIARTTALSNVELPMLYAGVTKAERTARAQELLALVGMKDRMQHRPDELSGGQKQRLCIARALLKKPKILILDDSTSAVDTATDARIRQAFAREIPGTTKLIIAQRVSSVEHADRIIVMHEGEVDGFGTHEQLLASNEIYRDVYESQTGGNGDFDEKGGM